MRGIIRRILSEIGFQIHEVNNGKEALDYLETVETVPDLILVDWNMPVVNGLDFIVKAKANPRTNNIPLLMVSSETEICLIEAALKAGAAEYVMKPFDKEIILNKLRLMGDFKGLLP